MPFTFPEDIEVRKIDYTDWTDDVQIPPEAQATKSQIIDHYKDVNRLEVRTYQKGTNKFSGLCLGVCDKEIYIYLTQGENIDYGRKGPGQAFVFYKSGKGKWKEYANGIINPGVYEKSAEWTGTHWEHFRRHDW